MRQRRPVIAGRREFDGPKEVPPPGQGRRARHPFYSAASPNKAQTVLAGGDAGL